MYNKFYSVNGPENRMKESPAFCRGHLVYQDAFQQFFFCVHGMLKSSIFLNKVSFLMLRIQSASIESVDNDVRKIFLSTKEVGVVMVLMKHLVKLMIEGYLTTFKNSKKNINKIRNISDS